MVRAIMERHGRLDCLVNSAGIAKDILFLETSLETFNRVVAVNPRDYIHRGPGRGAGHARYGGGSIVSVASVSGIAGNVQKPRPARQ